MTLVTATGWGPTPGDAVELDVERIAHGGEGVGRADGLVVFIPRTAPGDRVRATVIERHPRWARARLEAIVDRGPERVEPGCAVFDACGGCQIQHLGPEAQRAAKTRAVTDAFERIARRALPDPPTCAPAAAAWHYRQRAVFTWRAIDGRIAVGFHSEADPDAIVPIVACPIFAEPGNRALAPLIEGLAESLGAREVAPPGRPMPGEPAAEEGRLAVRALPGGTVQAGVFARQPGAARPIAERCASRAGIPVTWGRWVPGGPLALAGDAPRLECRIAYRGLALRVGFDSFIQTDLDAAERLYDAVLDGLAVEPGEKVVDGYAGIGIVTCQLAAAGAIVTAVESHPGAASDLRANAAAVGGRVHVLELPAERVDWSRPRPDAIVLNPPRGGCPRPTLASIGRSTARRLVYVACDPTTLARDVRRLGPGWRIARVAAFDMFPQTAHVETVARLERNRAA